MRFSLIILLVMMTSVTPNVIPHVMSNKLPKNYPTHPPTSHPSTTRMPTRHPSTTTGMPTPRLSTTRMPTVPPTKMPTFHPSTQLPLLVPTSLSPTPAPNTGIKYYGGMVFTNPTAYIVWYGTWTTPIKNIVEINISNHIAFGGSITDNYSYGTNLTEETVHSSINNAIINHHLPYNPQGVYLLLGSGDVTVQGGFCNGYCGWHSGDTVTRYGNVASAFIGWASACPVGCAPPRFFQNSTNGQLTDGLINVMSHEMMEAITDPFGDGWNNREMGDKCVWKMGTIQTNPLTNKTYNIELNGNYFLVQTEWVNAGTGFCSLAFP